MEGDKYAWLKELEAVIPRITEGIRRLAPADLAARPEPGGPTASDILAAMIRMALALKEAMREDSLDVEAVRPPSFAGPEEASAILTSALENTLALARGIPETAWLSPLHIHGETKDRGHIRGAVAVSLLEDLLASAADIGSIARSGEAVAASAEAPPDPEDPARAVSEKIT